MTQNITFDAISYGSRYQPETEAAEMMSLPEGILIIFSRGLRHVAEDSRRAVLSWLARLPSCPPLIAGNPSQKTGEGLTHETIPQETNWRLGGHEQCARPPFLASR